MEALLTEYESMAVTLKQIAALTGLSIPTVHQILNGYSAPFAEETRKKVLAAAAKLNYTPNITAQSLVRQRSFLIGVLFYEVNYPIITQFLRGLQIAMKANRCTPVFLTHASVAEETENLESVMARRIDGLIVNAAIDIDGRTNAARFAQVHQGGLALVELFGRFIPGVPKVTLDYRAAAQMATERLVREGHQRIALLIREQYRESDPGHVGGRYWSATEFWRGYLGVIRNAGLKGKVRDYPVAVDNTRENAHFLGAYEAVSTLFRDPKTVPTAIVCYSPEAAEAVTRYIECLRDPLDHVLTVAAFGPLRPAISNRVKILSFPLPAERAGQVAGEMLFGQLAGRNVKDKKLGPDATDQHPLVPNIIA
jgi:DNA-binding LacI/PurR family transcriptional regulator